MKIEWFVFKNSINSICSWYVLVISSLESMMLAFVVAVVDFVCELVYLWNMIEIQAM